MRIEIAELRRVADHLLAEVEAQGVTAIELVDDYYWEIDPDVRYSLDATPDLSKPHVGQLHDDWRWLKAAHEEDRLTRFHLAFLAALLRYVSDRAAY